MLTVADAKAIEREAPSAGIVDVWLGAWGMPGRERAYYKGEKTKELSVIGVSENYAAVNFMKVAGGRFFTASEVQHRRAVVVLGETPVKALFPNVDPVGKIVRVGAVPYEVVGYLEKRITPFGDSGADDFMVVPYTTFEKQFGWRRSGRININGAVTDASAMQSAMIAVVPREGASRADAMAEVEQIMRIRHGLKLDQANDFDIITQDAALKMYDQITGAVFIGLVVISSIALMVGGIGVMAIMMISVTERTREIGVRKALGARRREILWQFLLEAVFLTSVGGVLGILLGAAIGVGVHFATGFPISHALVELRDRLRLLRVGRRLLRPGAGHPRRAAGPHRSAAVRVTWPGEPVRSRSRNPENASPGFGRRHAGPRTPHVDLGPFDAFYPRRRSDWFEGPWPGSPGRVVRPESRVPSPESRVFLSLAPAPIP